MLAATVTNMKNNNYIRFNGKEYPIAMRLAAKEKLTHRKRKVCALGR